MEISPWQLFLLGGPVMWLIFLSSVLALAIIIEKVLFLKSIKEDIAGLKNSIFDSILKNDIKAALKTCDRSASPLAHVLKAGVLQYGNSQEAIASAMQEACRFEIPRLEERSIELAVIGNVAPLLGFLGTIIGMCGSFYTMQLRVTALNPLSFHDIAGGVWQSLITTGAGLALAIPIVIVSNYFINYQNNYILQIEKAAGDLVNFIVHIAAEPDSENRE